MESWDKGIPPTRLGAINTTRCVPHRLARWWLALAGPRELVKTVEQPVGVVVAGVGRQADPQAAVVAQAQPARCLEGVEGTGRGVHAQRGQVPVRVPGVTAVEGQQQGRGAPCGPGPDGDAGQRPDVLLDPLPEPVLVRL